MLFGTQNNETYVQIEAKKEEHNNNRIYIQSKWIKCINQIHRRFIHPFSHTVLNVFDFFRSFFFLFSFFSFKYILIFVIFNDAVRFSPIWICTYDIYVYFLILHWFLSPFCFYSSSIFCFCCCCCWNSLSAPLPSIVYMFSDRICPCPQCLVFICIWKNIIVCNTFNVYVCVGVWVCVYVGVCVLIFSYLYI